MNPLGEICIFSQEPIARMNCDGVGHFCGADNGRHIKIAVNRCRRAYADCFIGQQHVFLATVCRGVNGDGLDS